MEIMKRNLDRDTVGIVADFLAEEKNYWKQKFNLCVKDLNFVKDAPYRIEMCCHCGMLFDDLFGYGYSKIDDGDGWESAYFCKPCAKTHCRNDGKESPCANCRKKLWIKVYHYHQSSICCSCDQQEVECDYCEANREKNNRDEARE